jgi:hypothetical protein
MSRTTSLASRTVVLLLVTCSSGCLVSSFHPIYDDASVVFDDQLIGSWENRETGVSVSIARGQWRSYAIEYIDRTGPTHFTGFLTAIGGRRFMNVRPEDGMERPGFLVATNGIVEVVSTPGEVRVRELDYDAVLSRLLAKTLKTPAATDLKENVVLTAETAELRQWLAASLNDERLFAEWKTLTPR